MTLRVWLWGGCGRVLRTALWERVKYDPVKYELRSYQFRSVNHLARQGQGQESPVLAAAANDGRFPRAGSGAEEPSAPVCGSHAPRGRA